MLKKSITFLLGILSLVACSKDYDFLFSNVGGPKTYSMDIDGASIVITIDGTNSQSPIFSEDYANPDDSQWFVEMDWIRVFYHPSRNLLSVHVDDNTTGKRREAVITALDKSGKKVNALSASKGKS